MKKAHSPLFPIFTFVLINIIVLSLSRLGLAVWQSERVSAVDGWLQLFLQGVRMDVVALCYLFGVPALLTTLSIAVKIFGKNFTHLVNAW